MLTTSHRRDRRLAEQGRVHPVPGGVMRPRRAGGGCAGGSCRCDGPGVTLCERHHHTTLVAGGGAR